MSFCGLAAPSPDDHFLPHHTLARETVAVKNRFPTDVRPVTPEVITAFAWLAAEGFPAVLMTIRCS
jgi:hypothetical protein